MNAGELRSQITLVDFTTESDGQGGTNPTRHVIEGVWAKVKPLAGSRGIDASQIMLEQTYEVYMRYEDYPPLNKKVKIEFENRTLIVQAFQIINERRKYFKIICKEDYGRDEIIYDEKFQPITDENGNYITTEE